MKYLKHWKYQCLFGAPFLPWVYVHWADWIYNTMIALGWEHGNMEGPVVVTLIFMVFATIVGVIGYCYVHEHD